MSNVINTNSLREVTIKIISELFTGGFSSKEIAENLNNAGFKNFNKLWNEQAVDFILIFELKLKEAMKKDNEETLPQDENYIFEHEGKIFTNSLYVAKNFDKQHKNILQSVNEILTKSNEFGRLNFQQSSYINSQNKEQPMFLMTKQGFSILAMGFTTDKAFEFKIKYIQRFEEMEKLINERSLPKPKTTLEMLEEAVIELKKKEALLIESKEQIKEKETEIKQLAPQVGLLNQILIKDTTTRKLGDFGKFLSQFMPKHMGKYKIIKYCLDKKFLFESRPGKNEVYQKFITGPKALFYIKPYTFTVGNDERTHTFDALEIRVTPHGAKQLLICFLQDEMLTVETFQVVSWKTEQWFANNNNTN